MLVSDEEAQSPLPEPVTVESPIAPPPTPPTPAPALITEYKNLTTIPQSLIKMNDKSKV